MSGNTSRVKSICADGSLPDKDGAPPVSLTQRSKRMGSYPATLTGPRVICSRYLAPRMSIHSTQFINSLPSLSTGTVPSPWVEQQTPTTVSYTHLRAHETVLDLVC